LDNKEEITQILLRAENAHFRDLLIKGLPVTGLELSEDIGHALATV
jgi:ribosome-binding factor A